MINKDVSRFIQQKFIKSFIDILVLSELAKSPLSGYDIILLLYKKFKFVISPGNCLLTALLSRERRVDKG